MRILKLNKVNTFLVGLMMVGILLCCSSQVQAAEEGLFLYTITDGKATITDYLGSGGDVTIPSELGKAPVTSIGESAFEGCSSLTSISIPEGVTSIGHLAFSCCSGLKSISIPSTVTGIGTYAFDRCSELTSISIPEGVTSIGNCVFYKCSGLTSILIPSTVTSIGTYAFDSCSGLTSILIPSTVTSIGTYAFDSCSGLTSISIPAEVTSVGLGAFRFCINLKSITFNSATTKIYNSILTIPNNTIPEATKIIGYSTSTAKDHAVAYGIIFVSLNDATLQTSSTVKGQPVTSLGTPNATLTSAETGVVTITAAQAADTSNAGSLITLFETNGTATLTKVVKYAAGGDTTAFNTTDVAYSNEAITDGDFFIVQVTATDSSVLYYKIAVTVIPADQAAPEGLAGEAPTTSANNDGKITGVSGTMEYQLQGAVTYAPVTASATEITSLAAGTYNVRYAAKTGFNAGTAASVTIPAHIATAAELANAAIATAKGFLPPTFTAIEGSSTNLLNYLNSLEGMSETGTTLTLVSSNANVASDGAISYTGSEVTNSVVMHINKTDGTEETKTIAVTIPAHVATAAELANAAITTAKGLVPATFTATEGSSTNLLNYMNSLEGMSETGTTLTLVSSNANVANDGTISYTGSAVINSVVVHINKTDGTEETKTIAVTIPAHVATAAELANAAITTAKGLVPATFTATEGSSTNLLNYMNSLEGMSETGTTLTLVSSNANVASDGAISYTSSAVTNSVVVHINKTDGTEEAKTIVVTIPAHVAPNQDQVAPSGLAGVAPTVALTDGKITGTTTAMEYKLLTATDYTPVTGTEITNLVAGTYNVRYAVKTGFNVGIPVDVVVAAGPSVQTYTVTLSGGTETTGVAPTQAALAAEGTFVLPGNPFIKASYTFAGWNDGTTTYAAGATYTMPAKNVTLTAQWTTTTLFDGNLTTVDSFIRPNWDDSYPFTRVCTSVGPGTKSSNYFVRKLTPTTDGDYTFKVTSADLSTDSYKKYDTVLFIYRDSFDPNHPLENILAANDDNDTSLSGLSESQYSYMPGIHLSSTTNYYLVMTTFHLGLSGDVSFTVDGPGSVAVIDPPTAVTPTVNPVNGTTVISGSTVVLSTVTSGATIYYTTDGTMPTASSSTGSAITITGVAGAHVVVKAIATKADMIDSPMATFTYTLSPGNTLTYDGNGKTGGNVPTDSNTYAQGATITVLGNTGSLVKTGYTFAGWSDGTTTYAAGVTYTMPANAVTFTVQWTATTSPNTYTVTFTGGTETTGTAPNQGVTAASGTFVLPANPFIKTGYTFTGWNDGTTTYAAGATYTMPADNVTLTAQWTENEVTTYTVTFTGGTGTTGTAPTQEATAETSTFVLPANPFIKTGYTFAGWSDGTNTYAAGATYTMPANAVTFTAQWTATTSPNTFNVTFTGGTETTGTAPNQGVTAASGTFVLPANPFIKTGYTFTGWNDGTTTYAAGVTYTMPANAVTLTAQWTANASNTHTVNGTIKDTNGNPVSSATVTLTDITDSTKKYTGTTDADGNYSIPGVPDESYTVTVTKGSVTLGSGSVTVNGGDVTGGGGNITVTPPTPPSDPTHTVTGTIKDTNNNPVSGGTVTLTDTKDSSKTYTGTTNGNGNYSISGVPDESYTVTVTKGSETLGSGSVTVNGGDVTGGGGDITVISPTYTVIGNVKDEETNAVVDGATLKLMAGSRLVAQASTDGNGDFSISGIPNGTYNLVISKGYQVITRTITVSDDITTGSITLPKGNKNSVVEVKDNTPDIIVDKLNDFFNSDKFTLVDRNVVVAGGTVEIKLVVEKKSESAATNADSIKSAAGSGKTIGMFLDLTVNKIVTPSGSTTEQPTLVTELADVLIIDIPLPAELQGKSNYVIYRYHGAGVQTITPTINADGEYIELSADGKSIKLYTKKFSTYAIAYTAASTPSTGGGGGSGGGSSGGGTTTVPTNTSDSSTGGKVTISTDKKTATIIPDDGYIISDVLVDGKSVGATSTYTFTDSENHTIKAVFVKETGVNRLAGENSVDTALEIAKAGYKGKLSNVVLATAQTYPDALAGSVLAYKLNAPILLVGSTETDQKKVLDYLETNLDSAGTVYILGGTAVVSSAMEANVTAIGCKSIIRLGGVDRYETAMKIADHLELTTGTSLVLVNGESYPDALSISSMAGIMQSPILLIQKDGISEEVKEKIAEIQPEKVYIIGLEGVISTVAEREVARITTLTQESIIRIGGFDRYETSLAVAQYFNLSGQSICIATGNNFPDALAGSVYAANFKAPIILVNGSLSEMQINYLKTRKITGATIFGGAAVISNDLEQQLGQLIEK